MTAKDNFLLKISQREVFNELSDEEAGRLIKGIFNYVCDGDSGLTGVLNAVFIPIKTDIDKNEEKYKIICERNKKNGQLGGRPKNEKQEEPKETQNNPVGNFGENTHISYITNHNNHNSYNHNSLEKDNRGMGEEEKTNKKPNDGSLLQESEEIINYLNKVVGTKFRSTSKETQKHIKARLDEKFTVDDFKQVIDNMASRWMNDKKMNRYLRPETLFGTKFEGYLNEKKKVEPTWLNKENKVEQLTGNELKEMQELMSEFK